MALSLCAIGLTQLGGLPLPPWFRTGVAIVVLLLAIALLLGRDTETVLRITSQMPTEKGCEAIIRTSRKLHPAVLRITWSGAPHSPLGATATVALSGTEIRWSGGFSMKAPVLRLTWLAPPFRRRDKLNIKLDVGAPVRLAKVDVVDPSEILG